VIHDFVARWASLDPDRVALEDLTVGRSFTYGQLADRAGRLAVALRDGLGLPAGARVAMLTTQRAEVFEAFFACARAGLVLVPLNTRLALPELQGIIADAAPEALLYDDAFAVVAAALDVPRGVALGEARAGDHAAYEALLAEARPTPSPGIDLEAVSLVLYTSGTTGKPKGVMLPWRQVVFNAVNTTVACGFGADDASLACLPLFHTGGLHCLSTPLLHLGGRVVLTGGFDPAQAVDLLASGRVTTTIAVPTMYEMLLGAGLAKVPSLKALLCGGAPCPLPLLDAYHDAGLPLRQGYGLTEVGPNCFTLSPLSGPHRLGSVGCPAFHGEARLVDDDGGEVTVGEGELWLRGPHVTAGYLNNPEATAEALDDEGWFHTGDALMRTEDGVFYVVGRKKNMFISGGENVYPTEVEGVLLGHPSIVEVAVVAVPDPKWGEVGLAAMVLREGDEAPAPAALRAWAKERLAGYKVPRHWRFLDALPLTSSGKPRRKELVAMLTGSDGW
jgi:fatty-acyl-CoA synthase